MSLCGFLNVYKPPRFSSFDIVRKVAKMIPEKVGHLGTLDPLAEGVLILAIGRATKLTDFFLKKTKKYRFTIKFGISTTTYDAEGEVTERKENISVNKQKLLSILPDFAGKTMQTPPIFSARKFKGKRLYRYARNNMDVDLEQLSREIEIYEINLLSCTKTEAEIETHCSSGTYIRSLAVDICKKLNVPGHVTRLIRLSVSDAAWGKIENACSPDDLTHESIARNIIPLDTILSGFPAVQLKHNAIFHLKKGRYVPTVRSMDSPFIIKNEDNRILGLGSLKNGHIHMDKMLQDV